MRYPMFWLGIVISGAVSLQPASSAEPVKMATNGPATIIKVGNVGYMLPFSFPSSEEILRALPVKDRPTNAQIQCLLLVSQLEAPRVYPRVGRARLVRAHFQCTVSGGGKSLVVYLDRDHLIPE